MDNNLNLTFVFGVSFELINGKKDEFGKTWTDKTLV